MQKSEELDFVQSAIPPGLSVIEASAGTGKTFAISHLVPRLLLDKAAASLAEILLVTFTNDAARELAERVRRVIELLAGDPAVDEEKNHPGVHRLRRCYGGDEHRAIMRQALLDIDRLNVSTIHSFCQRTIQAEGVLCGLPVMPEVITDAAELIDEALYEIWQEKIVGDPFLAAMAHAGGWSLGDDLLVVRMACGLEGCEPLPAARDFEQTLEMVEEGAGLP